MLPNVATDEVLCSPFNAHKCQLILIDFTLSNARQFYLSMGNPSGVKGLNAFKIVTLSEMLRSLCKYFKGLVSKENMVMQ